jgi:hypothetical protein
MPSQVSPVVILAARHAQVASPRPRALPPPRPRCSASMHCPAHRSRSFSVLLERLLYSTAPAPTHDAAATAATTTTTSLSRWPVGENGRAHPASVAIRRVSRY